MMEEIIKKIEKKGYKGDKELALNIFNELRSSIRHIENIVITLPTTFIAFITLFRILEIEYKFAIIIVDFLGFIIEAYVLYYYLKTKNFLKKLRNIILEDPMEEWLKEALKDFFPYLLYLIITWIVIILLTFY